jgi:transcriptional regulator with XRE-family HTH domain
VTKTRSTSVVDPPAVDVARLMFEAVRRAEAMGIVEGATPRADMPAIRQLANKVRRAGIAASAADILNNVETPSSHDIAQILEVIVAALDASPAPAYEWKGLTRVFPPEDLAELLQVSLSSLKRYQSGERETPDSVAARLHFLALVVGDLAGSYNDTGIRRWFQRKRTQLDGRSPAALLKHDWDPDDEGAARVRALARSLVTLSAT